MTNTALLHWLSHRPMPGTKPYSLLRASTSGSVASTNLPMGAVLGCSWLHMALDLPHLRCRALPFHRIMSMTRLSLWQAVMGWQFRITVAQVGFIDRLLSLMSLGISCPRHIMPRIRLLWREPGSPQAYAVLQSHPTGEIAGAIPHLCPGSKVLLDQVPSTSLLSIRIVLVLVGEIMCLTITVKPGNAWGTPRHRPLRYHLLKSPNRRPGCCWAVGWPGWRDMRGGAVRGAERPLRSAPRTYERKSSGVFRERSSASRARSALKSAPADSAPPGRPSRRRIEGQNSQRVI